MHVLNSTKIFCCIANPGTDLIGVLYNDIISELGIDGVYLPLTVKHVGDAFAGSKSFNFTGVTVSMPYKKDIIPFLDGLDETAQKIDAVNTIVCQNDQFIGFNTDCFGAIKALEEKVNLAGKDVLLIGAGGAASAIAYGLKLSECNVTICNRTYDKALTLSNKYGFNICSYDERCNLNYIDVIINATSVGFLDNEDSAMLVNDALLSSCSLILDVVFSPVETSLIKKAKSLDIAVVLGSRMLVHQALNQFELWGYKGSPNVDRLEQNLISFLGK